jgi:hypothetical protein
LFPLSSNQGPENHLRSGIGYLPKNRNGVNITCAFKSSTDALSRTSTTNVGGKKPKGVFSTTTRDYTAEVGAIYLLAVDSYFSGGNPADPIAEFEKWVLGTSQKKEVTSSSPIVVTKDDFAIFADFTSAIIGVTSVYSSGKCGSIVGMCDNGENCITDGHSADKLTTDTDSVYVCTSSNRHLEAHAHHYDIIFGTIGALIFIGAIIFIIYLHHHHSS